MRITARLPPRARDGYATQRNKHPPLKWKLIDVIDVFNQYALFL